MEDLHGIFTKFKEEFPMVYSSHEALGKEIHENSGPLSDRIRWLIKIAISGASHHPIALETHIMKATDDGVTDDEIKHALLLLIQTSGFPTLYGGLLRIQEYSKSLKRFIRGSRCRMTKPLGNAPSPHRRWKIKKIPLTQ